LAETSVLVALATVLFYFKLYTFPQGGEITFGSMTPILLLALRRGMKTGVVAGVVFSLIVLALEPMVYYPAQFLLDYPLAFGSLGVAGLFRGRGLSGAEAGVAVGIGSRFVWHFLSGIIFFASFTPVGESPVLYSAIYNASYLLPEMAISGAAMVVLVRRGIVEAQIRKDQ
jgi:thiamine transporter